MRLDTCSYYKKWKSTQSLWNTSQILTGKIDLAFIKHLFQTRTNLVTVSMEEGRFVKTNKKQFHTFN